jgi:hypothetical protein
VLVHAPAEVVAPRIPVPVLVEAVDEHTCVLDTGADSAHMLAVYLGMLDLDFEVSGPPELLDAMRRLTGRYLRALDGGSGVGSAAADGPA